MTGIATTFARMVRLLATGIFIVLAIMLGYESIMTAFHAFWKYAVLHGSASIDMQYSGSRIFFHGRNPYEVYLSGNPDNEIILYQTPNYAHTLYLLMAPLGMLDFSLARHLWSILNYLFAIGSIVTLSLSLRLHPISSIVLAVLALSQPAFGILLDNGQHGMLILAAVVAASAIMARHGEGPQRTGSMIFGLSYLKYSFAPSFAAAVIRHRGVIAFLWSLVPVIIGVVVFIIMFGPGMEVIFGPLLCAADSVNQVSVKMSDLMTIIHATAPGFYDQFKAYVAAICLLLSFFVPLLSGSKNPWEIAAFCAVSSLSFVKHLPYDHVLLWLPLAYFLSMAGKTKLSWIGLGLLSWYWLVMYYEPLYHLMFSNEAIFLQADIITGFVVNISILLVISACARHTRQLSFS
ncbi:MAG: hypothetical protein LWW75_09630 [Chlorobiales bacterium]|nr:hypothetical protein [Chlorobiales bacterium]